MSVSAVCLKFANRIVILKPCLVTGFLKSRNMSTDWKTPKEKYLGLNAEEKRPFYSCGTNFKTCTDIPTWDEYFRIAQTRIADKIDILGGYEVNPALNSVLAKKISIFAGDITTLEVDAVVNAANASLLGGGGVDGAIHKAAGPELKEECRSLHRCNTGEAKMTGGYRLPAKYIIHTVGPQKEKPDLLTACYKNCLDMALKNKIRTIAFPCVSTGVYGYPIDKAAHVACRQVRTFLENNSDSMDRIIFCLFGPEDVTMYEGALQSYFPVA